MEAQKLNINVWDKDQLLDFKAILNTRKVDADLFEKRNKLHDKLGSNEDFLGNGLTKNLVNESKNKFGVVETFTFEHTPQNLATLKESDAITIVDNLKPIGSK